MKQGIQIFLQEAGEAACYALCIIRLGEVLTGKSINALDALELATDKGWVFITTRRTRRTTTTYVKDPPRFSPR